MKLITRTIAIVGFLILAVLCTNLNEKVIADPHSVQFTKGMIDFRSILNNSFYYEGNNTKELYLYIDLKSGKATVVQERPPLNISLVLDKSGSMSGDGKLIYAKQAVNFVVDNVSSNDNLSIVIYDHHVDVLSKSSKIQNKDQLKSKINMISPGGSTNLSGGMLEGYSQVKSTFDSKMVNRVLLLSDGLQNAGITDPVKIRDIAKQKNVEDGITISTFGVGADFNEDLMTEIAEYGSGNYYFIDAADKIPQIIAQEIKGLLSVVAQNAKLSISYPNSYLSLKRVYGYPYTEENGNITVNFKDIFSEEQKSVLLKFEIVKPIDKDLNFESILSYDDASTYKREELKSLNTLSVVKDLEKYKTGFNEEVKRNIILFESNDMMSRAIKLVDERKFVEAQELLKKDSLFLQESFKTTTPDSTLNKQYHQVIKYKEEVKTAGTKTTTELKSIQKSNKASNYQIYKKK